MMISREVNLSKEFEKVLGNDILDSMEQYIKNSVKEVASNNASTSGTKELDEYIEKICYRVMSTSVTLLKAEIYQNQNIKKWIMTHI